MIVDRVVRGEGHQADDLEIKANQTESWVCFMERMVYMLMDSDTSKEVDENDDSLSKGDFEASLKTELLTAMNIKVKSAVGAARTEVLQTTLDETLRNVFLNGFEVAKEGVQDSS